MELTGGSEGEGGGREGEGGCREDSDRRERGEGGRERGEGGREEREEGESEREVGRKVDAELQSHVRVRLTLPLPGPLFHATDSSPDIFPNLGTTQLHLVCTCIGCCESSKCG